MPSLESMTIQQRVAHLSIDLSWWPYRREATADDIIEQALKYSRYTMATAEHVSHAWIRFAADGELVTDKIAPADVSVRGIEACAVPASTRAADRAAYETMRDRETEKFARACRAEYDEKIASWDWPGIVDSATANREPSEDGDNMIGRDYLGSQLNLFPSGKIYAPWTSNQTARDEIMDGEFSEALDAAAEAHGGWIDCDSGDVFFCIAVDAPEDC